MKQQLCLLSTLLVCCLLAGSTVSSAQPFILSDQTLDDGAILSNDGKRLISAPVEAVDYRIPEGVEVVAAYAFFNCADLQSITFPGSVKVLEPHAFDGLRIITLYVPHDAPYLSELPSFFKIVKTGLQSYTVTFEKPRRNRCCRTDHRRRQQCPAAGRPGKSGLCLRRLV